MSAAPQLTQPPAPPTQIDQARMEYDRLIAYFKLLVWVTGALFAIVLTAAGALLFKSTTDMQTQLNATRDTAAQQISSVATAAQATATKEAQKAIDAAFERQNVQRLIETVAQKKVDATVDEAVRKNLGARIEVFSTFVERVGEIANHGAQLRLGYRAGLDALVKETENADPKVRAYARSTLLEIGADYERAETQFNIPFQQKDPDFSFLPYAKTPKALMGVIRHGQDPFGAQTATKAFLDMKKRVGWDVPMFDIPGANKWCDQHKPKCDE